MISKDSKKFGGDFYLDLDWLSNPKANIFSDAGNCLFFDTGRGALLNILKNLSCKKVLLPNYICQSVVDVFSLLNAEIVFYRINGNLTIDIANLVSKIDKNTDVIFFINYFGQTQPEDILNNIKKLAQENNITIIEDTTHSIFTKKNTIGDYCIASLRKWFALPDGAIAYSQKSNLKDFSTNHPNIEFVKARKEAMISKAESIKNKSLDEEYLKLYEEAENIIARQNIIYKISDYSLNILNHYNYGLMIEKRKNNFLYLENNINNPKITPVMTYNKDICPMFYPIFTENRDDFRQYLFNNNIYCPIHWGAVYNQTSCRYEEWKSQNKELSVIIDQRYDIEDMEYIAKIINEYQL